MSVVIITCFRVLSRVPSTNQPALEMYGDIDSIIDVQVPFRECKLDVRVDIFCVYSTCSLFLILFTLFLSSSKLLVAIPL